MPTTAPSRKPTTAVRPPQAAKTPPKPARRAAGATRSAGKTAGLPVAPEASSRASVKAASTAKAAKVGKVAKVVKADKGAKGVKAVKADEGSRPEKSGAASVAPVLRKARLVRDSFTMPEDDFALIDRLKSRAIAFGHPVKKSELLRAGLQVLAALDDAVLQSRLSGLPRLKTGRPGKHG